jgi:uroporphyrinogen decarboxylase
MIINMKEWQREIIESDQVQALPIMTYPGLALTEQSVMDVVTKGDEQFLCMHALSKRYPAIASVSMMDLSVEAEAFGSRVQFSDREAPTVVGSLVTDMKGARALKMPAIGEGRTSAYLKAVQIAAGKIKGKPVFGGQIGPFSLACRLMEMKKLLLSIMRQPDLAHVVLEKTATFLVEYAQAIKAAGANGVIIAEPAAGLISPAQCDEFSSRYVRRIVDAVQDKTFTVILHNCGNTVKLVDSMLSTGAAGLHFGNAVKMRDIMPQIPPDRLALGNIDPAGLFKLGTPEQVAERVEDLLDDVGHYRNFVLSSGCDIPPGTPLDNVDAFFDALAEYNVQQQRRAS